MGLTIHYDLHYDTRSPREARRLVEELRKKAFDLPFAEVGEVVEFAGDACDFEKYDRDDPLRYLVSRAGGWFEREGIHYRVMPKQFIMFSTSPGEGCEDADFGLAIYPGILPTQDPRTGHARRLRTGLSGWCWSSFCKTIYASRHGIEHFVKCHLSLVAMLDHARELGLLAGVGDEGGFWESRDLEALVRQAGEWQEGIAAQVRKTFGDDILVPKRHQEAEGGAK